MSNLNSGTYVSRLPRTDLQKSTSIVLRKASLPLAVASFGYLADENGQMEEDTVSALRPKLKSD